MYCRSEEDLADLGAAIGALGGRVEHVSALRDTMFVSFERPAARRLLLVGSGGGQRNEAGEGDSSRNNTDARAVRASDSVTDGKDLLHLEREQLSLTLLASLPKHMQDMVHFVEFLKPKEKRVSVQQQPGAVVDGATTNNHSDKVPSGDSDGASDDNALNPEHSIGSVKRVRQDNDDDDAKRSSLTSSSLLDRRLSGDTGGGRIITTNPPIDLTDISWIQYDMRYNLPGPVPGGFLDYGSTMSGYLSGWSLAAATTTSRLIVPW